MSLNKSKALRTAEKYVLQGKIPAAIDEYRKVVNADPGDLTTINTLGDLYVRAGRIQDAISNFSRIADSYREGGFTLKAIAMLKKISKLDPTNVETAMKLANLYSQQGLLVEARQQYLQVADAYARAGQTRKALEAYQKIADLDPSNTSVRMKLGEIYSREGMTDQAHDVFIMAGAEFLRKGDGEQALNANLKAIIINPDSRQALTAIATIYTQQGQTDRAINILCEAFERNPGDVELLTILGRTYLAAGMMDDAERTFLSLVELDKNRFHYLLEVGRRFLQIGDMDRAVEQIDGCLEVLIAKREEDKAIDFLRRVLDKEMDHIGALKQLAQIFLRIREDHNLIATLNSLVEAAMRKGDHQEAIAALKELARLEPDEPLHLQRLYNLGVQDITEPDSPDVIRATGPLDFQSAAFDDTFVIRQISEAEILAGHGQVAHAVEILTAILVYAPENVQVHLKLKDIYLRAGIMDKAANECLQVARIHEGRGEAARASDYMAEAHQLDPLIDPGPSGLSSSAGEWGTDRAAPFSDGADVIGGATGNGDHPSFEIRDAGGLDWSRYKTGALADSSFVTVPGDVTISGNGSGFLSASLEQGELGRNDAFIGDTCDREASPADMVFNSATLLPSDTMPRLLRDELEGIDFYIAQGYVEIARGTLDRLRVENGDHPEILARYNRLGESFDSPAVEEPGLEANEAADSGPPAPEVVLTSLEGLANSKVDETIEVASLAQLEIAIKDYEPEVPSYDQIEPVPEDPNEVEIKDKEFFIQKESGPLYPDLLVNLNTSELLNQTPFDAQRLMEVPSREQQRVGTGDLIDSLVSSIDSSLDSIERPSELSTVEPAPSSVGTPTEYRSAEPSAEAETEPAPVETAAVAEGATDFNEPRSAGDELQEIFEDLKEQSDALKPLIDFETHYSLGLAYKDMELLDEAISEFQMAFRAAGTEDLEGDCINCCNMLGVCFKSKRLPKIAIMWFERGLKIQNRLEDEYQALRYEIGICYEEMGEIDKAIEAFMQVYGIDVNYREVAEKVKQLQAAIA